MENDSTLFNLSVDAETRMHLGETAKWARFLAIAGMVALVLMVLFGIYFASVMAAAMEADLEALGGRGGGSLTGFGIGTVLVYVLLAVIWFFPLLFLLRFANLANRALEENDQKIMNGAFKNLKACFRYVGIVTIAIMVLYGLIFFVAITTTAAFT